MVETREVDFAQLDVERIKEVFQRDKNDLKVVVNNVGVMVRGRFLENNPQEIENILKVNIFSQALIAKYYRLYLKKNFNPRD